MKWTEIPSGKTNGAFQRLMVSLGEKAEIAINNINMQPTFVERLAEYAINGCIVPNASHDGAREIMGKNFFGIPEVMKHFGVNPTRRQLSILSEIPFTPFELMRCKDTHILIAVFPISICDLRSKFPTLFGKDEWYNVQALANDNGEVSWKLILKTPVANSTFKKFDEQKSLISLDEEVPTARIMVYTIIGHYLNTGEILFEDIGVRTSSLESYGRPVDVKCSKNGSGLLVYLGYSWCDSTPNIGVSVTKV